MKTAVPYAIITLLPGILYWRTLLPHIGFATDTTKFQYIGYTLSTTHETGYPVYTLLTFFFTRLFPFGRPAFRANLFSAICTVVALCLFYALLRRYKLNRYSALLGTLLLAATPTLWKYSLVAEVYTLNLLFIVATLYCLVSWHKTGRDRWFYLFALVYALGFGNHLTMILLLPAVIFYVLATDWRTVFRPRNIVWVLVCIGLGMATYLYIYWRSGAADTLYLEATITDWSSFMRTVTGQRFQNMMFVFSAEQLLTERLPQFADWFAKELSMFGWLAVVGILFVRDWRFTILLLLTFLTYTGFNFNYAIPDLQPYLIPGFMVCAAFVALAIDGVSVRVGRKPRHLLIMLTITALAWQTVRSYPLADQSWNIYGAPPIEATLTEVDSDAVIILPNIFEAQMAWYYLFAENQQAHNIYAVYDDGFQLSPDQAAAYLTGDGTLHSPYVAAPPNGLRLYCYSQFANCDRYTTYFNHSEPYPNLFELTLP